MINKIKKYLKKVSYTIIGLIFYPFVKIDNRLLLFGTASGKFSDNAKYLYLYILKNEPHFKPIWITNDIKTYSILKSKGFPVEKKDSLKAFILAMKAKFYFFTHNIEDVSLFKRKRNIAINLWHGSPLKKMGFDSEIDLNWIKKRKYLKLPYELWNFIVVANEQWIDIFRSSMRISEKKILPLGLPRNDILWKVIEDEKFYEDLRKKICHSIGISPNKKLILYAPTFRDEKKLRDKFLLNIKIFLSSMEKILEETNSLLLLRLHPFDASTLNIDTLKYKHILNVSNYEDVQELLAISDVVISDYSSLVFDYTILNRPILLYWYDFNDYISARGGIYKTQIESCAIICNDLDDVKRNLEKVLNNKEKSSNFKSCSNKYNLPGHSSKRIAEFIKRILNESCA